MLAVKVFIGFLITVIFTTPMLLAGLGASERSVQIKFVKKCGIDLEEPIELTGFVRGNNKIAEELWHCKRFQSGMQYFGK